MPRYRLYVIGSDLLDTVRCAGGWLFDRALAGWEVTALVQDLGDERPLRILGAYPADLESASPPDELSYPAQSVAISAKLYTSDMRIRRAVMNRLSRGPLEVLLWGDTRSRSTEPGTDHHGPAHVRYQPSLAAALFKSHALAAAGLAAGPGDQPEPPCQERFSRVSRGRGAGGATQWC